MKRLHKSTLATVRLAPWLTWWYTLVRSSHHIKSNREDTLPFMEFSSYLIHALPNALIMRSPPERVCQIGFVSMLFHGCRGEKECSSDRGQPRGGECRDERHREKVSVSAREAQRSRPPPLGRATERPHPSHSKGSFDQTRLTRGNLRPQVHRQDAAEGNEQGEHAKPSGQCIFAGSSGIGTTKVTSLCDRVGGMRQVQCLYAYDEFRTS